MTNDGGGESAKDDEDGDGDDDGDWRCPRLPGRGRVLAP